jgi:hypothetical protein
MNLAEMSEQEKSVMLARLCDIDGLEVHQIMGKGEGYPYHDVHWMGDDDIPLQFGANLYSPANMALLAKAIGHFAFADSWPDESIWEKWDESVSSMLSLCYIHEWMVEVSDYTLQLAVEAGLIETEAR